MKWFFDKTVAMLSNNRGEVGTNDDDNDDDIILDDDVSDDDNQDDGVTIDLDDDDSDDDDNQSPSDKAFAAMRVENKELKKLVEDLKSTVDSLNTTQPQQPTYTQPQQTTDQNDPRNWTEAQWDELAKKDWKKAVDLRSKLQAEEIQRESMTTSEFNKVLEESKQTVLRRHPELNDPNSEKAKVYRNIVTANPDYTVQKKGPIMAMYEMEEYMEKNMGYKREEIIKAETQARADEAARYNRVQLTSTRGHNISEGNKVTLTRDEMDFCKLQGIDPKVYAGNKKRLAKAGKGGIQL